MIKRLNKYIALAFLGCMMVGCASISTPEGGPVDSLPPIVVGTMPAQRTTNFAAKKVLIKFNEFVQLKDQQKLFTVSPPGKQKPLLTVKGKSIEVLFEEPLDSNTTYKLDFGSSIIDNNESNRLDGFTYIFSTGSYIDSLLMAGQVVDAYTRDSVVGAFLYYFDPKADSMELDSTLFKGKVEGLFRTDSSGYFVADILKDKDYRIYAVADMNGNQTYEAGSDYVGFVSDTFNPVELDGFTVIYDSLTSRMTLDSLQVFFEVFKEDAVKRQNFLKAERPLRQKLVLSFNAPGVIVDTLELEGIDSTWIEREYNDKGDTLTLWIKPPTKMDVDSLRDTLKGRIVYERHDSVWQYYPHSQKLTMVHKIPVETLKKGDKRSGGDRVGKAMSGCARKRMERRARKAGLDSLDRMAGQAGAVLSDSLTLDSLAVDSVAVDSMAVDSLAEKKLNPFKFTVNASQNLNPDNGISFLFEYPLRVLDSAKIELVQLSKQVKKGRAQKDEKPVIKEIPIAVNLVQDTLNQRLWRLEAPWKEADEYKLMIPSGKFEDIGFMSNDTLKSSFTVITPDKFGMFTVKTLADSMLTGRHYIFELLSGFGKSEKIVMRRTGVAAGESVPFKYITPGEYRMRIIEDLNENKKWDTGVLTARKPSERVRIWKQADSGSPIIISKENWEVEMPSDLRKIFEGR